MEEKKKVFRTQNFEFVWDESQRGGSRVKGIVNSLFAATINYKGGFCEGVKTDDIRHLPEAVMFAEEIKNFSGTWERFIVLDSTETKKRSTPTGRVNNAHVYFWLTRGDQPRHSHKLCEADPAGEKLWEMFRKNPKGFMDEHPELCSKKGCKQPKG